MNRSNSSSESVKQDAKTTDYGGGPAFHPDLEDSSSIRSHRIIPKGIVVSTDNANDEQDVLFDGTTALNSDLYAQTAELDAKPSH